ncbi:leucine-rich repeat-containing protein 23-like [Anthonomus grandis grandis]|uniref:leucine-rich repeat-containing protein 23-like n=1 Tax=Anthonomus grandis grandis TaxID=2921223 RepID=UPI002165FAD1|nr:leucine-rich repeat-containing protein 23-like [Anthonomus grandis grandis]
MTEGEFGEASHVILHGEGHPYAALSPTTGFIIPYDVPIVDKSLTFEEASKCLNTLGKDESGVRYAYLMITATDRKLTEVSVVLTFKHVLFLDLSGNFLNLEALQVLQGMPFLILLRANRNRVESGALNAIHYLQVLCLNINKIEHTYDIAQPMLETLQLEFNQIFTAQFDSEKLPKLKELDLKGNHLMDLSGEYPQSLERLYLAQNKITRLNELALSKLTHLTTLHLRDNKIRKLNGFTEFLGQLTYLNLRSNSIMKLRQFRKLACLPKLESLVYTDNPLDTKNKPVEIPGEGASEDDEEVYGEDGELRTVDVDLVRIGVLVLLPNLKRINKDMVTLQERDEAFLMHDQKIEQIMSEVSSDEETEPPTTTYTSDVGDSETEEGDQDLTDPRQRSDYEEN